MIFQWIVLSLIDLIPNVDLAPSMLESLVRAAAYAWRINHYVPLETAVMCISTLLVTSAVPMVIKVLLELL